MSNALWVDNPEHCGRGGGARSFLPASARRSPKRAASSNLSLDGTILLSAMAGFAGAYMSGSLLVGFGAGMIVGALVALLVAYGSIALRQDQVAIGFVLTLLCTYLSSFLGTPFVQKPGPSVPHMVIPGLVDIPVIGPIFFGQDAPRLPLLCDGRGSLDMAEQNTGGAQAPLGGRASGVGVRARASA